MRLIAVDRGIELEDSTQRRLGWLLVSLGVVGLLLVGAVATGAGAGLAAAQAEEEPDADADEADNPTVTHTLDEQIRVGEHRYDAANETFTVELHHIREGGDEALVQVSEIPRGDGGAEFRLEQQRVLPGESLTVDIGVSDPVGADPGVTIVSERSIRDGRGVQLFASSDRSLFSSEPTYGDVRSAAAGGIGGTLSLILLTTWLVISTRNDDYEVVR